MNRRRVLTVHIALAGAAIAAAGVVGWRWVEHAQSLRALERARAEREQAEQRVLALQHTLATDPPPDATRGIARVPERQNLAEVLESIERAAQEARLRSFQTATRKPGTQKPATPGRQTFDIQGQAAGPQELARFVALLENAPRLLVVHAVEARGGAGGALEFTVSVAAHHRTRSDR